MQVTNKMGNTQALSLMHLKLAIHSEYEWIHKFTQRKQITFHVTVSTSSSVIVPDILDFTREKIKVNRHKENNSDRGLICLLVWTWILFSPSKCIKHWCWLPVFRNSTVYTLICWNTPNVSNTQRVSGHHSACGRSMHQNFCMHVISSIIKLFFISTHELILFFLFHFFLLCC